VLWYDPAPSTNPFPHLLVPSSSAPSRRFHRIARRLLRPVIARRAALALLLGALLPLGTAAVRALEEVPYVATPLPVVDAILDLAGVGAGDVLFDLGSGDGRVVITAARRFGTRGVGFELDPRLVELARQHAAQEGVADAVRFEQQDLFRADLRAATVVTLYLLPDVNLALRSRLLATLRPGTRIVSHDYDMGDWRPDRQVSVAAPGKPVGLRRASDLYLWTVPADVSGRWAGRVRLDGREHPLVLELRQAWQVIEATASLDGEDLPVRSARLDGDRVGIACGEGPAALEFALRADAAGLHGRLRRADGSETEWHAARTISGPARPTAAGRPSTSG